MRKVAGTLGVTGALAVAAVLVTAGPAASGRVRLHVLAQDGTVSAYGLHFHCQGSCFLSAAPGSVVVLQVRPKRFFSFSRWKGACHGKATACVLSLNSATSARAVFTHNRSHVLVTVGGAGSVGVAGLSKAACGAPSGSCDVSWPAGKAVTLAAVPAAGGAFGGWGRACAGTSGATCRIVVGNRTVSYVTAAFATTAAAAGARQQVSVHTDILPLGSSLAGFSCPEHSGCATSVATGTLLRLHVREAGAPGGQIWHGDCVGAGFACALVVEGPVDVVAPGFVTFGPPGRDALNINVAGGGIVTDGHGLNCTMARSPCTIFSRNSVRLTAKPANAFSNWISFGVCPAKRASCTAKLSSSGTTVTARFKRQR